MKGEEDARKGGERFWRLKWHATNANRVATLGAAKSHAQRI